MWLFFTERFLLYHTDLKSASKLMNVNLYTEAEWREIAIPLVFVQKTLFRFPLPLFD